MVEEELWESAERDFQAYGRPLINFTSFKYMRQILTVAYNDWTALVGNLRKAQMSWAGMARILRR